MKTIVEYHIKAQEEIQASRDWYARQRPALGQEFCLELQAAEEKIANNPTAWPLYTHGMRRFAIKRFPYSMIYEIQHDRVIIISVAHDKRNPGFWKNRLG